MLHPAREVKVVLETLVVVVEEASVVKVALVAAVVAAAMVAVGMVIMDLVMMKPVLEVAEAAIILAVTTINIEILDP